MEARISEWEQRMRGKLAQLVALTASRPELTDSVESLVWLFIGSIDYLSRTCDFDDPQNTRSLARLEHMIDTFNSCATITGSSTTTASS